jgi:hypothetical protein
MPIYVIGRPLKPKDLARGLSSCASAEALKLAARDPRALVAGLLAAEAAERDAAAAATAVEGGEGWAPAVPASPRSEASSAAGSFGSLLSVGSGASSGSGSALGAFPDDAPRLPLMLPEDWRAAISDVVLSRLDLLVNRVTLLAIDDGRRAAAAQAGGGGAR